MSPDICSICNSPRSAKAGPCAVCGASPSAPTHNLPVGTRLQNGKFALGQKLGDGGFGITYLGAHRHLKRTVAIKELFPQGALRHGTAVLVPDSQKREFHIEKERVLEEARAIACLDSPCIVEVQDSFLENNTAYIVMEYLEGESLKDRIDKLGALPPDAVHRIGLAVCDALIEVHRHHLLHRDIKPENIMLTRDGRVVLVDFGSARAFNPGRTVRHTVIVTPEYAAPEMFSEQARFGPRADLFCLGGTLFHALTGGLAPFSLDRLQDQRLAIEFPGHVQGPLSVAIDHALQIRVEDRPPSAEAFKTLLLDALYGAGSTPLHRAVSEGNADAVRALLGTGADPNLQDKSGTVPLHLAVSAKFVDVVRVLLQAGAALNVQDQAGQTPLHLAKVGSEIFGLLLEAGANPNIAYENGKSPLYRAVSEGNADAVRALLGAGAALNVQDQDGQTPLHLAKVGSEIFGLLLEAGANPNITYENGKSPLYRAVSEGIADAVRALLGAGADPNFQDKRGTALLHLAVSGKSVDAVGGLLQAGAAPNVQDQDGQTPLHLVEVGSAIFGVLLDAGANPNIVYGDGSTPLYRAVSKGAVELVGMLLVAGADPNIPDGDGVTPLHLAAFGSDMFKVLLEVGADPNIVYGGGLYAFAHGGIRGECRRGQGTAASQGRSQSSGQKGQDAAVLGGIRF